METTTDRELQTCCRSLWRLIYSQLSQLALRSLRCSIISPFINIHAMNLLHTWLLLTCLSLPSRLLIIPSPATISLLRHRRRLLLRQWLRTTLLRTITPPFLRKMATRLLLLLLHPLHIPDIQCLTTVMFELPSNKVIHMTWAWIDG
jgi:hypothetical protein